MISGFSVFGFLVYTPNSITPPDAIEMTPNIKVSGLISMDGERLDLVRSSRPGQ